MQRFLDKGLFSAIIILISILSMACLAGGAATAIPAGRPAQFELQTSAPTPNPTTLAAQATLEDVEAESAFLVPLGDAPTHTPDPARPSPSPTPRPSATAIPTLLPTPTSLPVDAPEAEPPPEPTPTVVEAAAVPTSIPDSPPAPPLEGGDWDFESDYVPWGNPYGEPCPGASVAAGWTAFVEAGEYGSSCLNENLYGPNVFSGRKSQEITFDFIAANSGVLRSLPTTPNHRYSITAYAKHDWSAVPVEMFLGIDLTGDTDWQAESVEWFLMG